MNRIYKTQKNRRTGALTAVSELQRSHGKKSVSSCAAAVASALLALGLAASGAAYATPWSTGEDINLTQEIDDGTTHVPGTPDFTEGEIPFAIGDRTTAAKTYESDIFLTDSDPNTPLTYIRFNGAQSGEVTLDLTSDDVMSLWDQSQGFEQDLVTTTGTINVMENGVDLRNRFALSSGNAGEVDTSPEASIFHQYIAQGPNAEDRIGRATYVFGEEALKLRRIDGHDPDTSNYVNGLLWSEQEVSTRVVLAAIDIDANRTLLLQPAEGTMPLFGARLTGEGGVTYRGNSAETSIFLVAPIYTSNTAEVSDILTGGNTYTGPTAVENITLILGRPDTFGQGGDVTLRKSAVQETDAGTFGAGHALAMTDSSVDMYDTLQVTDAVFDGRNSITNDRDLSTVFDASGTTTLNKGTLEVRTNTAATDSSAFRSKTLLFTGGAQLTLVEGTVSAGDLSVTGTGNRTEADGISTETLALADKAAFELVGGLLETTDLSMTNGTLAANSVSVGSTLSDLHGTNTLTVRPQGEVFLENGLALTGADTVLTVNGKLTALHDSTLDDARLATTGRFKFGDLVASGSASLDVSGSTSGNTLTLADEAAVTFTGGAEINQTISLSNESRLTADGTVSANSLVLANNATLDVPVLLLSDSLVFADTTRTYATRTQGLSGAQHRVELHGSNVTYGDEADQMTSVASTLLSDGSYLTVGYANAGFLGESVAMETSNGHHNRLTLTTADGIQNFDLTLTGETEDVVELKGTGTVTLSDTFAKNTSGYDGWIRMTGTTLYLTTEASKLDSTLTSGQGVSAGAGGTLRLSGDSTLELNRIGWSDPGDGQAGVLDLSDYDFSANPDAPALRVDSVTVNGSSVIRLDQSVVTGLDDGSDAQSGDSVFQTLANGNRRLVIETTANPNANQINGIVKVDVTGGTEGGLESKLTGYFNADGTFAGTTDSTPDTGVATGTWSYTTLFSEGDLYVTHGLAELELRGLKTNEKALELEVDGATDQDFNVKLTGSGDFRKTGAGTLTLRDTGSDMSGTAYVEAGELVAYAGALGTAALDVAGQAAFTLRGGEDTANTQTVKSLTVADGGTVAIESDTASSDLLTLSLAEGGSFAAGSTLTGSGASELALTGGTLEFTDIEKTTDEFAGTIDLAQGTTLALHGNDRNSEADLSLVRGAGTINLGDAASYTTQAGFTGRMNVLQGGELTIGADAVTGTSQGPGSGMRYASLASENGSTVRVAGTHAFDTIDLSGTVDFGTYAAGDPFATGTLVANSSLKLHDLVVRVDNGEDVETPPQLSADRLLSIDNAAGATAWLVRLADGASATAEIGNVDVDVDAETGEWTANLMQGDDVVGTVDYTLDTVKDAKGLGLNYHATAMQLTQGELELAGSDTVTSDSTLDLAIHGTEKGGIRVTEKTVTLAKEGSYGTLSVNDGATVSVLGTQTLSRGGEILGTVETADGAELRVTGETLTVGTNAGTDFAVNLAAENASEDATKGATLRFDGRRSTEKGQLFEGTIAAAAGSRVEFSETNGNFTPIETAAGNVAYALFDSDISFGDASAKDFKAEKVAVDTTSTARFDLTGKAASAVDLSDVTGTGTLALKFTEAGGTLAASGVNKDFTGTLAFENAELTIGTDTTLEDSTLNAFAKNQGSLEVGTGSILRVDNAKIRAGEGAPVDPKPVTLAGNLTLRNGATLDFTPDIRVGDGDEYLGNPSGVSVNAVNMNGHAFSVDGTATVKADIDDIDFSSGLTGNGAFEGSILDLIGTEPEYPVLALVTDVGNTDNLGRLATALKLDAGENAPTEFTVEYWQPDWTGSSTEPQHVADVHTGAKIVADAENKSLAIGAGITRIDVRKNATLRIDPTVSTDPNATTHRVGAAITGDDTVTVVVTGNLDGTQTNAPEVIFEADNTYTGETRIEAGASVTAAAANAFATSRKVSVGVYEGKDGAESEAFDRSTLTFVRDAATPDAVTRANLRALELGTTGDLVLEDRTTLALTDGASAFAAGATVTGGLNTGIRVAGVAGTTSSLEILDPASALKDFDGYFAVGSGSTITVNVDGTDAYTWKNNVGVLTDNRSRALSSGEFVKTGTGTLVLDGTVTENLAAMNLMSLAGTTHVRGGASVGSLTAASTVTLDGVATFGNLTAQDGNLFMFDVATGAAKAPEGTEGDPIVVSELGANGSDGIRVTGNASGTFRVAVNSTTKAGAEERIRLLDVAERSDTDFCVELVNASGAAIPGVEIGGYDYVLVTEDRATGAGQGSGTDVWLSSIMGDDGLRNTTVSAGSYLGVAAAAQLFDISLHDRMSNRSWLTANADGSIANSFWVIEQVSHERYGDSTGQIDVHDTASTTTVGSDILSGLAAGGTWYAGAMFSYATEDTKSRSTRTGLESRADTDAWAAGFYAGWQLNAADRTGPYVDGWLLWSDAESDVKGTSVSETAEGSGLSASIEAGWGFKAFGYGPEGRTGDLYLEPHVSVTWFGYEADDISNAVHDVTFEGKDNIRTKLGVKAYAFSKSSNAFSPYVELNWIHNTETYGVTVSGVSVEQMGADDQGEVRAGADWRINDAFTVWGHLGYSAGSDSYSNREATLGVRYVF